jgi:hypothetical protein
VLLIKIRTDIILPDPNRHPRPDHTDPDLNRKNVYRYKFCNLKHSSGQFVVSYHIHISLEKLTNEVLVQYLANGDGAVDVGDAAILRLRRLTVHVVLLDVICNKRSTKRYQ